MEAENSLGALLKEWPQALEIQISNPKIVIGTHKSKIIFQSSFDYAGIDVIKDGVTKDISDFKVEANILCGGTKELESVGTLDVFEKTILMQVLLPPDAFNQATLLLRGSVNASFLHLECLGFKQQEPKNSWHLNEGKINIKEASIVFLQHQ